MLIVCALLCGCAKQAETPETIRLKFWTFTIWNGITGTEKNGRPEDWPLKVIREFEAARPGVKIDLEVLTWQSGNQKLDLSVLSGTYPDVCYYGAANISKYANQGILEPIDSYLTPEDLADFHPNILKVCRYNGNTYVWPWLCNTLVLAINRDIFRERGIEHLIPKEPDRSWTFDEFLQAAQACTFDRNGDGKTDVYGYSIYGIPTSVEYMMLTLVLGHGARLYSEEGTEFLLNSPEAVRGLQFLLDLQDKYRVVPPGASGMQYMTMYQMFFNQETAILSCNSGIIRALQVAAEKGEFPLFSAAIVQPPHLPGKDPMSMLSVGGYVVFKQKDKKRRDLAMEFARFLTNTENGRALKAIGQFSSRKSAGDMYPGDPDMRVVTGLIPLSQMYHTVPIPELTPIVNSIFQQVFMHAKTPEQALADAKREANRIIERELYESR